ncbi:putative holin [Serratia sp. H402Y]|uniref:putative holin n=1 Tax=Serratia sp. H402Y TaxID=3444320 RepID=UPI003EB7C044
MSLLHKVRHQRLRNWIILAVVLLLAIAIVSPMQLGVTLYKLSLVSIAAILGYHLDRALFPYASPGSYLIDDWKETQGKPLIPSGRNEPEFPVATGYELVFAAVLLRRALIVSAICIGVTMGL